MIAQVSPETRARPAIPLDRTRVRTFVLLGDVHLTDVAEPSSRRLTGLVDSLTDRVLTGRGLASLVLMGDVVDLVHVGADERDRLGGRLAAGDAPARAKLDRIARAHLSLFAALGRLASAGGRVELITGNHDQELARPDVQEHLRDLTLGPFADDEARRRMAFHPFAFYRPGVLYAEHGHRYHAINSAPAALRAHLDGADEQITHPLGSLLTALNRSAPSLDARTRARETVRLAPALARALATTVLARQRPPGRTIRGDRGLLRRVAEATHLPESAVLSIDGIAPPEAGIRRALRIGPSEEPSMLRAARIVHAALSAAGAATPFYCFGHTHAADRRPLAADAAAEYLNAGAFGLDQRCVIVRQRPNGTPLARLCDLGGGQGAPTP